MRSSYTLSPAKAFDHVPEHPERTACHKTTGQYLEFASVDAMWILLAGDVNSADRWQTWTESPAGHRRAQRDTQRGSIRLTLLAFQAAMAVGIGSGVLSILAWAQAALGGVL